MRRTRRDVLAGIGALSMLPQIARAREIIDLGWTDLVPVGQAPAPPMIPELLSHDGPALSASQPASHGVRTDWNQQVVRLPGFIVPLDYSGTGVTEFLLVPFVGACIHVPPPPANQLVFVTTKTPYESSGLYEAVTVVGQFATLSMSTHLADVAYTMAADQIEPY